MKRQWYKEKLRSIIDALEFNTMETAETLKFVEKYEEIDRLMSNRDNLKATDPDYQQIKAKIEGLSSELIELMKLDLKKPLQLK